MKLNRENKILNKNCKILNETIQELKIKNEILLNELFVKFIKNYFFLLKEN